MVLDRTAWDARCCGCVWWGMLNRMILTCWDFRF